MKYDKKLLVYSIVLGLLITLVSSFLINSYVIGEFPDVQFVSIPIVGVSYHGHPLPWIRQIVYPGAEREIIWSHLAMDLIIWTILVFLLKKNYKGKNAKSIQRIRSKVSGKLKRKTTKQMPSRKKTSKKVAKRKATKRKPVKKSTKRPSTKKSGRKR